MSEATSMPLLSIIVPVYNVDKYVSHCLEVLCKQDYKNIEIIVVDDGSTDNSASIIRTFARKDKRIITIFQSNEGVSAARNKGLGVAEGRYITFVDADDYVDPGTYYDIITKMISMEADAAIYPFCREYNEGKEIDSLPWDDGEILDKDRIRSQLIPRLLSSYKGIKSVSGSVCRTVYRRDKISNLFFNEEVHIQEDLLYCIESYSLMDRILIINSVCYHYVKHDITTTESYRRGYYEESKKFERCIVNALKKANVYDYVQKNYWSKRIGMYSLCISNLYRFDAPPNVDTELIEIIEGFKKDEYIAGHFFVNYINMKKLFIYILLKIGSGKILSIIYGNKEKARRKKLSK